MQSGMPERGAQGSTIPVAFLIEGGRGAEVFFSKK